MGANGFTIIHYNVHSILHFEERLRRLLIELGDRHWDVLVLTETWREEKSETLEALDGHSWYGSGGSRGSKGVGFLLHRRWAHKLFHPVSN